MFAVREIVAALRGIKFEAQQMKISIQGIALPPNTRMS
jgi:hypothetical protein